MSHLKIEIDQLHFAYPNGRQILTDLSLVIEQGESVGIIGANGAGKSTLLQLLVGLLLPQSGRIMVGHTPLTPKTLPWIRERIGLVFQDPDDQLFLPTIGEDVAFGPRNRGLDEATVSQLVEHALASVNLAGLQDRPPYQLSGGEKKAASLATILAMEPDVLALDEPTASLDPRARREVIELLKQFKHTRLVTSHDLDMILDVCDRTIVLQAGRIIADGPSNSILTDEKLLQAAGLELPLRLQPRPF
ncbi:MAG: ABC transporter ATP-binding protein [Eubacteriales bacterium]|nr:ABC transporter ATP-binding protein [Eubacteriales bacterium]